MRAAARRDACRASAPRCVWNLRSGLNVAALQCQFAPTLLTLNHYNHLLGHHEKELAQAFKTLTSYFTRTNKGAKAAQTALDRYGTRAYSGFSTIERDSSASARPRAPSAAKRIFADKGQLHTVAAARLASPSQQPEASAASSSSVTGLPRWHA